jgi:hypothetical protein
MSDEKQCSGASRAHALYAAIDFVVSLPPNTAKSAGTVVITPTPDQRERDRAALLG